MTNSTHSLLPAFPSAENGKVVSAADAVRLIRDGDTVATGGFVGIGFAEEIAIALEVMDDKSVYASSIPTPASISPLTGFCRVHRSQCPAGRGALRVTVARAASFIWRNWLGGRRSP